MKVSHVFMAAVFANIVAGLVVQYLINNVSSVRRITGGI
jgi:hypothetical protein